MAFPKNFFFQLLPKRSQSPLAPIRLRVVSRVPLRQSVGTSPQKVPMVTAGQAQRLGTAPSPLPAYRLVGRTVLWRGLKWKRPQEQMWIGYRNPDIDMDVVGQIIDRGVAKALPRRLGPPGTANALIGFGCALSASSHAETVGLKVP